MRDAVVVLYRRQCRRSNQPALPMPEQFNGVDALSAIRPAFRAMGFDVLPSAMDSGRPRARPLKFLP